MLLLSHILIALSSLIAATACLITPSAVRLKLNYCLMAATLTSGTALVWLTHSPLLQSCLMGLTYLGLTGSATIFARRRLHRQLN